MAFFTGSVYSKTLDMSTRVDFSLPADMHERPAGGWPVAYLLHGLTGDSTSWWRRSAIDRLAEEGGVAVVMPEVQRSFYTDMCNGLRYFTWVTDELPRLCREMFGLAADRAHTWVAGLSMGGYGALKCGLARPDVFGACAGLSGAVDLRRLLSEDADTVIRQEAQAIVGPDLALSECDDLFALLAKAAAQGDAPRLLVCCGTEDFLYADNVRFKEAVEAAGLPLRWFDGPGAHEWRYWADHIAEVLDFFLEIDGNAT